MSKDGVPRKTRCFEGRADKPFWLKDEFVEMRCGQGECGAPHPKSSRGLAPEDRGDLGWWVLRKMMVSE